MTKNKTGGLGVMVALDYEFSHVQSCVCIMQDKDKLEIMDKLIAREISLKEAKQEICHIKTNLRESKVSLSSSPLPEIKPFHEEENKIFYRCDGWAQIYSIPLQLSDLIFLDLTEVYIKVRNSNVYVGFQ